MGLAFPHILTATAVDRNDSDEAVVRYSLAETDPRQMHRGIYIVTVDGQITYVGKFTKSFAKRWLYLEDSRLYHHTRHTIAAEIESGKTVLVYAASEEALTSQIGVDTATHIWINVHGIEGALIASLQPRWNSIGA